MKAKSKKLTLTKQVVQKLSDNQLMKVVGGVGTTGAPPTGKLPSTECREQR